MGGFGGAVLEALAEGGVDVPARILAAPDALHEHGSSLESLGLDADHIAEAATALVRRKVQS